MRLHILSDLHLEAEAFDPPKTQADLIILAGDIDNKTRGIEWAMRTFPSVPVLYVLGNHEYYGAAYPKLLNQTREAAQGSRVHVLENDALTIGEVTFFGCTLWTDFRLFGTPELSGVDAQRFMPDYQRIRHSPTFRRLQSGDTIDAHQHSRSWLVSSLAEAETAKKVIITHHAPSRQSVAARFAQDWLTPAFVSDLEAEIRASGAQLWIHGHTHERFDYHVGQTRVVCNPRGYPGEHGSFDPSLVIEV